MTVLDLLERLEDFTLPKYTRLENFTPKTDYERGQFEAYRSVIGFIAGLRLEIKNDWK